jgi:hypothetical protein
LGCLVMSGGVFDTKKHTNVKRRAEYRRINVYYKGLEKSKAERARRRRILELQSQGYTIKQIALLLFVSERTVKRDLSRIEPYVKKKMTQLQRELDTELTDWFSGLSLGQQLAVVKKNLKRQRKQEASHRCRSLNVTVDLDEVFAGRFGVLFKPDLPINMDDYGRITLMLEAGGLKQAVARIYVAKSVSGAVVLSTNQSMKDFVGHVFEGTKIVHSTQNK